MNIMIVNSKIKHKFKTILGVITNLVFDFILFFVTAYIRKHRVQYKMHYISLEEAS